MTTKHEKDRQGGSEERPDSEGPERKRKLELRKETIKDIDVPDRRAADVKGGDNCFTYIEPRSCC